MLNAHKKNKTIAKNPKNEIFIILFTTLVETLPRSMPNYGEQICSVLSAKMSFEVFLPCGPMLTKRKQETQGLGALLDKTEDKDHINLLWAHTLH